MKSTSLNLFFFCRPPWVITIVISHTLLALNEPLIQLPKRLPWSDEFRQESCAGLQGWLRYCRLFLSHILVGLMKEMSQMLPTQSDLADAASSQLSSL